MARTDGETAPLLSPRGRKTRSIDDMNWAEVILLLFALYSAVFLAALDTTVVSTLLSHIASDLKALDNISWVATAYLIAYSAVQPLYGKLSDIFGRKVVLLVCTAIFGVGCQICSMGSTITPLVCGRFLSGIGAGGMLSMSTIAVSDYVPLRKRGIFQGIGNIAFGTGASAGGLFGGWATSYKGWRFAFSSQVPMAALVAIIIAVIIENKKADPSEVMEADHSDHVVYRTSLERIDFVGSFALASSVLLFMLAVTTGGQMFPWLSPQILGFLISSVVLMVGFLTWEANYAVEPVMPLELLTKRSVISACFTNFFGSGLVYAFLFYCPIFLTAYFDYDYNTIGRRIVANFVGVALGSLGAGIIMRRTGRYYRLGLLGCFGMLCASIMFLVIPKLPLWLGGSPIYQSVGYFLSGCTYAAMLTVSLVALIASVAPEFQATVTSAQYTFRGSGSSVGVALAAAIFQFTLKHRLVTRVKGHHVDKVIRKVLKSVEAIKDAPKDLQPSIRLAYGDAGMAVFALCAVWALAAFIAASLGSEYPLEPREIDEAEAVLD